MMPWLVLTLAVLATIAYFVENDRYYRRRPDTLPSRTRAGVTLVLLLALAVMYGYSIEALVAGSRYF